MLTLELIQWLSESVLPLFLDNYVLILGPIVLLMVFAREFTVERPFWKRMRDNEKLSRQIGMKYFGGSRYRRDYKY
jgi:hypothetical protein